MDSKKVKIIIASALLAIAVILIAVSLFGGSSEPELNQAALEELEAREPSEMPGGGRVAPGFVPEGE